MGRLQPAASRLRKAMILFLLGVTALTVIAGITAALPNSASAQQPDPFELYRDFMLGRRSWDSLSEEERRQVLMIHRLLRRTESEGQTAECRDARQRARSAASDVVSYSRRLISCVEGDFTDDCSSELRRVRNAHSDYESAVSDVSSYCR